MLKLITSLHAGDINEMDVILVSKLAGYFSKLFSQTNQPKIQVKLRRKFQNPVSEIHRQWFRDAQGFRCDSQWLHICILTFYSIVLIGFWAERADHPNLLLLWLSVTLKWQSHLIIWFPLVNSAQYNTAAFYSNVKLKWCLRWHKQKEHTCVLTHTHVSWLTLPGHPNDPCTYSLSTWDKLCAQNIFFKENENVNLSGSSTMITM